MNTVFIYALNDPRTGRTRYVGKAKDPADRFKKHLVQIKKRSHRVHWLKELMSLGMKPVLEVLDEVPANQWEFWEKEYIRLYRALFPDLTNGTDGGDGLNNPTPSALLNLRLSHLGKKDTPETRISKSASGRGKIHSNNISGVVGVSRDSTTRKWRATIQVGKKNIKLGRFDTVAQAAEVRGEAERKYYSVPYAP